MNSTLGAAAGIGYRPPPFTASQWQELEHQALIFKYMMAGVPVPHELLIPIKRSFEAMASRFYHHPALGYCSLYGKKIDPEPGRCRRTDGKKWRCSKDAYPDSKYCERHMHRGRNRSRKPVETQHNLSHSSPSSSTITVLPPAGAVPAGGSSGSFQSFPLNSVSSAAGAGSSQLHIGTGSYGLSSGSSSNSRDFRYPYGVKAEVDEHSFFSEASGSVRSLGIDSSSLESTWRLMPSQVSSFSASKERSGSLLQSAYPQLHSLQDVNISSIPKPQQQQQHSFFGNDYVSSAPEKSEAHSLRPFFDEWPKTRDAWSDLEDDRSNRTSFSTTQLSMSIPMASSDFSTTSSHSPNDD